MAQCLACNSALDEEGCFCPYCGAQQTAAAAEPERRLRRARRIDAGSVLELGWGRAVVGAAIGEGGMGVVRRAWLFYDPGGPRSGTPAHPAAVKVLHPVLLGRDRARQLFVREAAALGRLSHPNVVHFFGLAEHETQLAIVMELVEGQPLSQIIQRHATRERSPGVPVLPFGRSWHYFSQLLGALAATHVLGILHRDVKSGNVLVRTDGVVKLTDYGIARIPAQDPRATGGTAPGTGAYMAPEQVRGLDLDARADLYAAGIVLYEMLTGVTPFDAPFRDEIEVRTAQLEETPLPISQRIASAPPVLDRLMARALAKDKMHRYASALELGDAFREALGLGASAGWNAQRGLAENAHAISQGIPVSAVEGGTRPMPMAEAEALRSRVVDAYRAST